MGLVGEDGAQPTDSAATRTATAVCEVFMSSSSLKCFWQRLGRAGESPSRPSRILSPTLLTRVTQWQNVVASAIAGV